MAEETVADLVELNGTATLSAERSLVAMEATCEIEALCKLLLLAVQPNDRQEHLAIRGLSARIKELNSIVMSALNDPYHKTSDLAYDLRLEHQETMEGVPA